MTTAGPIYKTIQVYTQTHRALKQAALDANISMAQLIDQLVERALLRASATPTRHERIAGATASPRH